MAAAMAGCAATMNEGALQSADRTAGKILDSTVTTNGEAAFVAYGLAARSMTAWLCYVDETQDDSLIPGGGRKKA